IGYKEYIVARPDIYGLLWRQVPKERIHLGKKILSYQQNEDQVTIHCSDGSEYDGDIVVGADGAYSAIRQQLYKEFKKKNKLPRSDDVPLPFSSVCLVGQTGVLDPEDFPDMKKDTCQFYSILGVSNKCTWMTFTTKRNTMCWSVVQYLDKESSKENDAFRNSEWGPEAAEAMCKQVRHLAIPGGKDGETWTIGDLIDRTPKEFISKVMLEEKVFDTWYGGRTVLIGDACHKLNPSGGQGAMTAMHDAVALANWISTLESPTLSQLKTVFKQFVDERYPVAKEAFDSSQAISKSLGKSLLEH
ncbi:hypothetical protein BGZ94_004980, partial [Podila epigama]